MLISGGDVNVSYNRRVKQSLAKIKVDTATNLVVLTVNPKLDKVKGGLNEKAVSAKQMFANYRGGK
jgi:hypothetical protein